MCRGTWSTRSSSFYDYDFDVIFHLAASLSSKAEVATEEAHRINVEGTMQLLMLAAYRSEKYQKEVKFLFPSFDRRLRHAGPGDEDTRRLRHGGRMEHAAYDVRLQQALLRKAGHVLQPILRAEAPG